MKIKPNFWKDKRVLITGHTGFKGSWLTVWLQSLGAEVYGISLLPNTLPSLFIEANIEKGIESYILDIRDIQKIKKLVHTIRPEVVFHLAAQSLVNCSYLEPINTFSTNIMGTVNLLDALRDQLSVRVAVMVTTDKVYKNLENKLPFRENDTLGGHDPYSASKAASEIVISSYRDSYLKEQGLAVASARAGNVVGGGDWSMNRLIPDAIRAWSNGQTLIIRNPYSTRPWQHVLEPISSYIILAQELWLHPELAGAYNFGPYSHEAYTVEKIVSQARKIFDKGDYRFCNNSEINHEAKWLSLETTKARITLGINPIWSLNETLQRTLNWYKAFYEGSKARALCNTDIAAYEKLL